MDDPPSPPAPSSDAEETPTQRQARLRRERRQAKIAAEGPGRLAKITGIAGRRGPAVDGVTRTVSSTSTASAPEHHATVEAEASEDGARSFPSAMETASDTEGGRRGPLPPGFGGAGLDFGFGGGGDGGSGGGPDDPMRLLMQQILGGGAGGIGTSGFEGSTPPGGPSSAQFPPGMLPPMLAQLLEALPAAQEGAGVGPGMAAGAERPRTVSAASWRILHAAVSLLLALYVTLTYEGGFAGTKAARAASEGAWVEGALAEGAVRGDIGRRLFVWFATVEVVLQSGRYFLERGQLQKSGLLGTLAAFVPEPFAGYLKIIGRYNVIFSTLLQDALVIIFVLGLMVWWNGFSNAVESR